jgi:hypothetical protein
MTRFVLATKDKTARTTAWNVYASGEAAASARHLIPSDSVFGGPDDYEVIEEEAFFARQSAFYLGQPLEEITLDEYQEKLEILPPFLWERVDRMERFLMSEFLEADYTRQYARLGTRYFTKIVDVRKPSSWISRAMIRKFDTRR